MAQRWGPDDEVYGVTVCRACHLRGIHTGACGEPPNMTVERVEVVEGVHAMLWTFAGRRPVLVFRSLP